MKLYSESLIGSLESTKKKSKKTIFISLAICIVIFVLLTIFAKLKTRTLFIILGSLDLSIFSIILIYNLVENLLYSNDLENHIKDILIVDKHELCGKVKSISLVKTIKRNIHIREIELDCGSSLNRVYFNDDLFSFDLQVGENVKIIIANNYVFEYEVIK